MTVAYAVVGRSIPRADGPAKVTGAARYTADVPLAGALWARCLRSPLPHARIVRVDTSRAARVPGVRVVDLDGLQTRYCPGEARAAPVLAEAERVLAEEIARLDVRLRGLAASPRLAELHAQAAGLAAEEVARVLSRCPDLESHHRDAMREMAERLVQRVLYPVSRAVRSGDFD